MSRPAMPMILGALLLAAGAAHATSPRMPRLASGVVVVDGKAVFCQTDETFTILDVADGSVLVRDAGTRCIGWLRLEKQGLMLSTHWGRHRMIDVAGSVAQRRLATVWEVGSGDRGGCRSSRVVADRLICARADDFVVEARSLADGSVQWTYEAPGAVRDIIEREGRLMLQSGDYHLARAVSVVDFQTGQRLFEESIVQDAQFSVRSFDGREVVLEARPTAGSKCRERILRTLTPGAAGRLDARDACGPIPTPPGTIVTRSLKDGEIWYQVAQENGGTWIEGHGRRGRWLTFVPGDRLFWAKVYEGPDVLLVERFSSTFTTLECLDAATGHPRWLYVQGPKKSWSAERDRLKADPPRGAVPATAAQRLAAAHDDSLPHTLRQLPYTAPVVFDPLPR
jgi:PQQ-like domain